MPFGAKMTGLKAEVERLIKEQEKAHEGDKTQTEETTRAEGTDADDQLPKSSVAAFKQQLKG